MAANPFVDDPTEAPSFWERWGPAISQGAGAVGGIFAGRAAQNNAMQRSPEEAAALAGASGAAGNLGQVGGSLFNEGRGYTQQPASYYQTLLRGNRAAMANATAGPRAALNDQYRGAQADLTRSGVRGAARDQLSGNLNRQRAGVVSGLTTGVQPMAADALARIGQGQQQLGIGALGASGNIYGSLLQQGALNRAQAMQEGGKTGEAIGKMIADLGKVGFGGGAKKPTVGTPPPAPTPRGPGQGRVLAPPGGFTVPQPGVLGPPPVDVDYGDYGGGAYGDYGQPDEYGYYPD